MRRIKVLYRWARRHPRRIHIALGIVLAVFMALIVLWYGATVGAAKIFNHVVNERQLFPGTVTVDRISANMMGRVTFENLKWTSEDGEPLAELPAGDFRVSIWDVLMRRIGTTTLKELNLEGGRVHLYLDDNMQLQKIKPADSDDDKKDKKDDDEIQITGLKGNKKFICSVHVANVNIEIESPKRHFFIPNLNADLNVNTGDVSRVQINAGHFNGTVEAAGLALTGSLDFRPEEPVYDMDLLIRGCNPKSLNVGIDINDPADAKARISGQLSNPIIEGTLSLKELRIPALDFRDVKGDFRYEDGKLDAPSVTAELYHGKVDASGKFDLDAQSFETHIQGKQIEAADVPGSSGAHCKVDLDLSISQSGGHDTQIIDGSFVSGPGRFKIIPFNKISGAFRKEGDVLQFNNIIISMAMGDVTTEGFRIVDGKLRLAPIYVDDVQTGNRERVY
jgi:autotransporter translocation and assembly factor TamB